MLARQSPAPLVTQTDTHQMSFDVPAYEPPVGSVEPSEPSPLVVPDASTGTGTGDAPGAMSFILNNTMDRSPTPPQPSTHAMHIPDRTHQITDVQSSVADCAPATDTPNRSSATALDHDLDEVDDSDADVDGMGAVASNSIHEASTTGTYAPERAYFGPSSTLGFMKHIQAVLQPHNAEVVKNTKNERFGYTQAFRKATTQTFSRRHYVVPPKTLANALLSSYWNHVHPIYPYLFKTALNIRYQKLWSDPDEKSPCASFLDSRFVLQDHTDVEGYYSNEPIFFCIINLVFALGAQYSPVVDPDERCETGEVFFQRAKGFINLDSLEYGEVTLVQALLLMGLYLQSTDRSSMCWNIVGLAIRTSQSIGLDKTVYRYVSSRPLSRLDEEIRKRLWGGCIIQDRYSILVQPLRQMTVASMMFGRPLMLPPASIRGISLPTAVEEEELMKVTVSSGLHPSAKPNYITFFAHAVKLCQLVGEVLDAIYGGAAYTTDDTESSASTPTPRMGSAKSLVEKIKTGNAQGILELDAELTKWREDLPWFLQISTYTTASTGTRTSPAPDGGPILAEIPHELLAIFHRQAKILQARYSYFPQVTTRKLTDTLLHRFLHVKILLSRPVLTVLLSNTDTPASTYTSADALQIVLRQTTLEKISKHCIQAAQDVTNLVYDSLMSGDVTLPAWWYNVFCQPDHIYPSGLDRADHEQIFILLPLFL
ncbi:Fungal specific transcription factor domain-containing protein isoform 1 [Cladophialophora immunda]|nr:Fungal specific transcription factor domain-containing protein isoform 1 [Cladophialophora immunda]